jgi:RHS repeat-associated protein
MRVGVTRVNGDRLGSYEKAYPYGELVVGSATSGEKFATYWRDAGTGLDYAVNRYYSSQMGRFLTADPYQASGGPANPGSWNRYAYVEGDPVNLADPRGLEAVPTFSITAYIGLLGTGTNSGAENPGGNTVDMEVVNELESPQKTLIGGGVSFRDWLTAGLDLVLAGPCYGVFKKLGLDPSLLKRNAGSVNIVDARSSGVLNSGISRFIGSSTYSGTVAKNLGSSDAMTAGGSLGWTIFLSARFFGSSARTLGSADLENFLLHRTFDLVHEILHTTGVSDGFFLSNPQGLIFGPELAGARIYNTEFITQWLEGGCQPLKSVRTQ